MSARCSHLMQPCAFGLWGKPLPPRVLRTLAGGTRKLVCLMNATFTNKLTGEAIIAKLGKPEFNQCKNQTDLWFQSGKNPDYTGYVARSAKTLMEEKISEGMKLKEVITTFLQLADVSYVDETTGEQVTCPMLMPKVGATAKKAFEGVEWE